MWGKISITKLYLKIRYKMLEKGHIRFSKFQGTMKGMPREKKKPTRGNLNVIQIMK